MIKPEELRIGNHIYEAGEISSVYAVDKGGISFYKINDIPVNKQTGCTVNGGEERFNPIPLTPELLEKCGFEKGWLEVGDQNIFVSGGEYRLHGSDSATSSQTFMGKIIYLHQLQNLYYCLTGQELTVNL